MGCKICKKSTVDESAIKTSENNVRSRQYEKNAATNDNTTEKPIIPIDLIIDNDTNTDQYTGTNDHIEIQAADPQAFNGSLIQQRQQAINNRSYQSTIKSWRPKSLQQLTETIKAFSQGKSFVDRHWIIFYWIASNIDYDTVSYFSGQYGDQTAEGVFRAKKGVCAGYANLYKYLSDQLEMPCEVVSGYSKGYGFEDRTDAPSETDHAWNAVEIGHHWYLMESTWGAGHLDDTKQFKRELSSYYFLPRPNEMIYHHLPENEKWQLLRTPIKMTQYLQMPKLRPLYFDLHIELVSPRNQAHVDLLPGKPYALVLVRTPSDVDLVAKLQLQGQEIDGGHRVIFDHQKQLYSCYFAPPQTGNYKITIYAKQATTNDTTYNQLLDLTLDVKQMSLNPISFPQTWKNFSDLGLEVISPQNTHLIKLNNGVDHAQILIKTPENVELLGRLQNERKEEVIGGDQVYFDRRKNIWRCYFAPDRNGLFEALIMAKKKSDSGNCTSAVAFKIEARQIPSPPMSYPYTWPSFYDFDLKIEAPQNRSNAIWVDNASYAEVLIRTPDDVQLSCDIKYNNVKVENGSLTQYNNEKKLWQLLFAPERTGLHELIVYAKRNNDNESSSKSVVRFNLNVNKLRRSIKFPLIYSQFQTKKCQIYTPIDGILKKGSVVPIHCVIPGASDVNLTVDSQWLESEGYTDPILQRKITVGSKDVTIYAKYKQKSSYDGLLKYTVE
ncbi:unnamed protein product [Rotaria sordida]|uniref:Transglutaminase-like domain-containing protein n=3 Tax=Rotaria sordida TaxID=392033 RepID=A0A814U1Z5_9BILA|nr:unnamed protein product [Rotaria sordida]